MKKLIFISAFLSLSLSAQTTLAVKPAEVVVKVSEIKQDRAAEKDARKAEQEARKAAAGKGRNNRSEPQDPADALLALGRHNESLLATPNVVGTGVSWKRDGNPVIKVFTSGRANLPRTLDGIEVSKANVGGFYALNLTCDERDGGVGCDGQDAAEAQNGTGETEAVSPSDWHIRPVPIGVSIGDASDSAGTLGCRVSSGCHQYALSNAHVVTENGAEVLQPSALDGGLAPDDAIANMYASVPIVLGTGPEVANTVDAALYDVESNSVGTATRSNGYGEPRVTTIAASLDLAVQKYGRSSAMTTGFVDTINATVIVSYAEGDARFVNQFIVQSDTQGVDFSLPGDSGSLVVAAGGENDRSPVGLLFASGKGYTVANPIDDVLSELGVEIDGEF